MNIACLFQIDGMLMQASQVGKRLQVNTS